MPKKFHKINEKPKNKTTKAPSHCACNNLFHKKYMLQHMARYHPIAY